LLTGMHETEAGRQSMTLFESAPLVVQDTAILRPSLDLIGAYEKVRGKMLVSEK
jgi:hypothetical protein